MTTGRLIELVKRRRWLSSSITPCVSNRVKNAVYIYTGGQVDMDMIKLIVILISAGLFMFGMIILFTYVLFSSPLDM